MEQKNTFKEFLTSKLGNVVMIAILYFIIIGLTSLMISILSDSVIVAFIFAALFGYFGWQALNRITPDVFLILPIGGWAVYFLIKGALSLFIGVFVAPFVISKRISAAIQREL